MSKSTTEKGFKHLEDIIALVRDGHDADDAAEIVLATFDIVGEAAAAAAAYDSRIGEDIICAIYRAFADLAVEEYGIDPRRV